jgi:hypothetical protein
VLLSLRWIRSLNLGDKVLYRGEEWILVQGVYAPLWHLGRNERRVEYVHQSQFHKVRTLSNYYYSFKSGYNFYMTNWYRIWVMNGVEPWMCACNIWKGRLPL